jgi:hypothetical protein
MKRLRIMGVCLVAAAALTGAVAVSASATVPTWFECIKAAKVGKDYTGNYNDKLCTSANSEGKGKYDLREGVRRDRRIKGKSGPTVLHVDAWFGDVTVECKRSSYSGVPRLPNFERDVELIYRECTAPGFEKCSSTGAKKGEVRFHALIGELGYITESPVVVGVRLELESSPGGVLVSLSCGGVEATLSGALTGVQGGNVNVISKPSETVFTAGEYLGEVESEGHTFAPLVNPVGWESELEAIGKGEAPPHVLTATICGEYVESLVGKTCASEAFAGQDQTTTVMFGELVMIKT